MRPYYERGGITLYHGDCLAVLPTLAGRFDLIFTSPPYNLGNSPSGTDAFYRPGKSANGAKFRDPYADHDDGMPHADYVRWQRRVLRRLWRATADDGAIFYNHKPRIMHKRAWLPLECNPGLPLRQIVVWHRGNGMSLGLTHFCGEHEWLLVFAKETWRLVDHGASNVGDVWRFGFDARNAHPAPFPLALPARGIEATGARTVLDPFAGSGTTLLAAKMAGATAVGIEINERFCEMAARRLDQGVLPLFDEAATCGRTT